MRTKENIQHLNQLKKTVNALPDSKFEQAASGIICAVVQKFPLTYFSILNSNRFDRLRTLVLKKTAFLDKYETERKKKFTFATRIYYFINKKTTIEQCQTCGKPYLHDISPVNPDKYFHCNAFCAQQNPDVIKQIRTTKKQNHTTEKDLLDKVKARNQVQFGCDWYFQSDEFNAKKLAAWKSHGYDHPMHSDEVKKGIGDRLEAKYGKGIRHCYQIPCVSEHLKEINRERYGVDYSAQNDEFRKIVLHVKSTESKLRTYYKNVLCNYSEIKPAFSEDDYVQHREHDRQFKWHCRLCGNEFDDIIRHQDMPRCVKCHPEACVGSESTLEVDTREFIKSVPCEYDIVYNQVQNWNLLGAHQQLDIICISKKTQQPEIAFEVDGIYWHSKGKKVQGYHLEKTKKCEAHGIKLVHIFEDEWAFHRADMQKLIVNILQDKLDFNFSDDVIEVDRCKFNKCVKIPGYLLAAETAPTYIVRSMVEDKNECQNQRMKLKTVES